MILADMMLQCVAATNTLLAATHACTRLYAQRDCDHTQKIHHHKKPKGTGYERKGSSLSPHTRGQVFSTCRKG